MFFMMVVSLYGFVLKRLIYYERGTIQQIAESLYKGGFGKYDKG